MQYIACLETRVRVLRYIQNASVMICDATYLTRAEFHSHFPAARSWRFVAAIVDIFPCQVYELVKDVILYIKLEPGYYREYPSSFRPLMIRPNNFNAYIVSPTRGDEL